MNTQENEKAEEQRLIHMLEDVVTKVDRVQFMTLINTLLTMHLYWQRL